MMEKTPRELAGCLISQKGCPENMAQPRLPLATQNQELVGCGDWGRMRSTDGSAVFRADGWVTKIPMGELRLEPVGWATQNKTMIDAHGGDISPKTMVIIADNGSGPAPFIIQKEIDGVPICDTPLIQLATKPQLWTELRAIIQKSREVLDQTHCTDLSGLRWNNRLISRLSMLIPIFSDNIMVDKDNHVWLTDNTPDSSHKVRDKMMPFYRIRLEAAEMVCGAMEKTAMIISDFERNWSRVRVRRNYQAR